MSIAPSSIFQSNLAALAATSPAVARALLDTPARRDVTFLPTDEGVSSATTGSGLTAKLLASARRPLEEARRLASTVDLKVSAGALVLGFGLGYHARALVERLPAPKPGEDLPPWGVIVIFEPDLGLLRAVLEHVDHSPWLRRGDVVLVSEPTQAAVASAMRRREALPFLGTDVAFVEHPAQRARLGGAGGEFIASFREWIRSSRTTVVTTLANGHVTMRNALMNLDRYVTVSGVSDLAGAARGRPAIVVSAGPSLARNIHLLKTPGLRDRFVIVAVQTVLKTLLAEGVRPHFVTALDYHEVSRRFYEGLTGADVDGVTLVVEPKANPAILTAFPGAARVPADPFLEELIGEDLSRLLGSIRAGATVAHMAYDLARLLQCDPVILVGQDLGFTDGQYYAAGAAIHRVWSGELGPFRTLEMLEWERIVRGRYNVSGGVGPDGQETPGEPNLLLRTDILGRPIYTDQQMATYLSQFERDFRDDAARGLRVIDATEGGVAKDHAPAMTLEEAIAGAGLPERLELPAPVPAHDAQRRASLALDRVRKVRQDVWRIAGHSRTAAALLQEMLDHQQDQTRVNRLIGKAHTLGEEVGQMRPAFALVQHLNQAGSLKRVRADRAIMIDDAASELSPMDRQRRELERDLVNVQWLADAADELGAMLDATAKMLQGGERLTGEAIRRGEREVEKALGSSEGEPHPGAPARGRAEAQPARARVVALIPVDPDTSGLGLPRDLSHPVVCGASALCAVLHRLARCREIDGAVIICRDSARVRALIGTAPPSLDLTLVQAQGDVYGDRARAVGAARLWSPASWRGALGGLSSYDEACIPAVMAPILEDKGIDAAAIVGADWALVDPALIDAAARKFREGAGDVRLVFCQAPAGLGTAIVERTLMRELAANAASAGALATIGGRLSYSPLFPMPDPITNLHAGGRGRPVCVAPDAAVRDCGLRFVADSGPGRALLARAAEALGEHWPRASAAQILSAIGPRPPNGFGPRDIVMELCTGRLTSGSRGAWLQGGREGAERPVMPLPLAERILRDVARHRDDAVVTFYGAGDPLLHPDLPRLVQAARRAGIGAVHIRTDLIDDRHIPALLGAGVDVISVDLMAETPGTYRSLMGADLFERARTNLASLLERRASLAGAGGLPVPWIVPRITRCDATYEEIEPFYDRWLLTAGAAVIDALPAPRAGERIAPLPAPVEVSLRAARERMVVRCDGGVVPGNALDFGPSRAIGDLGRDDMIKVWKKASGAPAPATDHPSQDSGDAGGPAREREGALVTP